MSAETKLTKAIEKALLSQARTPLFGVIHPVYGRLLLRSFTWSEGHYSHWLAVPSPFNFSDPFELPSVAIPDTLEAVEAVVNALGKKIALQHALDFPLIEASRYSRDARPIFDLAQFANGERGKWWTETVARNLAGWYVATVQGYAMAGVNLHDDPMPEGGVAVKSIRMAKRLGLKRIFAPERPSRQQAWIFSKTADGRPPALYANIVNRDYALAKAPHITRYFDKKPRGKDPLWPYVAFRIAKPKEVLDFITKPDEDERVLIHGNAIGIYRYGKEEIRIPDALDFVTPPPIPPERFRVVLSYDTLLPVLRFFPDLGEVVWRQGLLGKQEKEIRYHVAGLLAGEAGDRRVVVAPMRTYEQTRNPIVGVYDRDRDEVVLGEDS